MFNTRFVFCFHFFARIRMQLTTNIMPTATNNLVFILTARSLGFISLI